MTRAAENPPAFPVPEIRGPDGSGMREGSDGMSLRDWFAGQAIAGAGTWMPVYSNGELANPETLTQRAHWAYQQADALLAARGDGQ